MNQGCCWCHRPRTAGFAIVSHQVVLPLPCAREIDDCRAGGTQCRIELWAATWVPRDDREDAAGGEWCASGTGGRVDRVEAVAGARRRRGHRDTRGKGNGRRSARRCARLWLTLLLMDNGILRNFGGKGNFEVRKSAISMQVGSGQALAATMRRTSATVFLELR
jgi:hypothetical protein